MSRMLKIGTRESALALWQAKYIQSKLQEIGCESELVLIKSDGELDLVSPLYEMGVQGIFTKALDIALLQGKIDIAVHSLKDVPTQLPKGLVLAAVPERGNNKDVLVYKNKLPTKDMPFNVATSSLRRSSQWLYRYNSHQTTDIRGNINTRLQKLMDNADWNGVLFAAAGIERINLDVPNIMELDWMIPAPAQGALAVVSKGDDKNVLDICKQLNHEITFKAVSIERNFLRILMGGCTMPIGAEAQIDGNKISFIGCVLTVDGEKMTKVTLEGTLNEADDIAAKAAEVLLATGGKEILATFRK